jgi:hypothetical protein
MPQSQVYPIDDHGLFKVPAAGMAAAMDADAFIVHARPRRKKVTVRPSKILKRPDRYDDQKYVSTVAKNMVVISVILEAGHLIAEFGIGAAIQASLKVSIYEISGDLDSASFWLAVQNEIIDTFVAVDSRNDLAIWR